MGEAIQAAAVVAIDLIAVCARSVWAVATKCLRNSARLRQNRFYFRPRQTAAGESSTAKPLVNFLNLWGVHTRLVSTGGQLLERRYEKTRFELSESMLSFLEFGFIEIAFTEETAKKIFGRCSALFVVRLP